MIKRVGLRLRPARSSRPQAAQARAARRPARRARPQGQGVGSLHAVRQVEPRLAEQSEHDYRTFVAGFQPVPATRGVGVAATNGARLPGPSKGKAARQG
jgi:hypothetical protein